MASSCLVRAVASPCRWGGAVSCAPVGGMVPGQPDDEGHTRACTRNTGTNKAKYGNIVENSLKIDVIMIRCASFLLEDVVTPLYPFS